MTIYLLIREDQNEHGFIDTSIAGVFLDERVARQHEASERRTAREQGMVVEDDDIVDAEWQVSWKVEAHDVDPTYAAAGS